MYVVELTFNGLIAEVILVQSIVTVPVVAVIATAFAAPNIIGDDEVTVPVTPAVLNTKLPPATIGAAAVVLKLRTVKSVFTFTVKLLANTSSAEVGNIPVFQTVVSDQLPDFVA
jgi:hypothetical protein